MTSAYYSLLTILKQSDFIFPFSKVKMCFPTERLRLIFSPAFMNEFLMADFWMF